MPLVRDGIQNGEAESGEKLRRLEAFGAMDRMHVGCCQHGIAGHMPALFDYRIPKSELRQVGSRNSRGDEDNGHDRNCRPQTTDPGFHPMRLSRGHSKMFGFHNIKKRRLNHLSVSTGGDSVLFYRRSRTLNQPEMSLQACECADVSAPSALTGCKEGD